MNEIEQKAIKEMEAMLEEHFIANNHSNCDVGYSYSEIHFCKERDIKGVAHSIATALYKQGYRKQSEIKSPEPTTAEMLLDGAEKTGYIEAIRLVKNRKWSVTIGGYQGLSEKLSEAILIAYKEAIRNEEINDLAEQYGKEDK